MDDKSLYFNACIFSVVVFAAILLYSIVGGIFYGIATEHREYVWTGGIFAIIALGVEILVGCCLYKNKRKITDKEKGSKNEDKNH